MRKAMLKGAAAKNRNAQPTINISLDRSEDLQVNKKKRKKKTKTPKVEPNEWEEANIQCQTTDESFDDVLPDSETDGPKKKRKKKKHRNDSESSSQVRTDTEIETVFKTEEKYNGNLLPEHIGSLEWSTENAIQLIENIEKVLPPNDTLKYNSRISKLDWNSISFGNYTADECSNMWKTIQSKVRCYRILTEVLEDARSYIRKKGLKNKEPPGKPTKPTSSYLLFYMDMKDKVLKEHPGLPVQELGREVGNLWRSLSSKKAEKYRIKAQKLRNEYDEKLKEYYDQHPEVKVVPAKKSKKGKPRTDELGFQKPRSAYQCYYEKAKEKLTSTDGDFNYAKFQEKCKEKWALMAEKKKAPYIELAQKEEAEYKENLQKYALEHPGFVAPEVKTLITKKDKRLLNHLSGKPEKPLNSAYSIFSKEILQSDSIKNVPVKDRLTEVSKRWKDLSEKEKKKYQAKCDQLSDEYKRAYNAYLDTLTPEQRQLEIKKPSAKKKKEKITTEPEKPPSSAFELYKNANMTKWAKSTKYSADEQAHVAWKGLSESEKNKYEEKLNKLNQDYVDKIAQYLNHCPQAKIAKYVKSLIPLKKEGKSPSKFLSSEDSDLDSD